MPWVGDAFVLVITLVISFGAFSLPSGLNSLAAVLGLMIGTVGLAAFIWSGERDQKFYDLVPFLLVIAYPLFAGLLTQAVVLGLQRSRLEDRWDEGVRVASLTVFVGVPIYFYFWR